MPFHIGNTGLQGSSCRLRNRPCRQPKHRYSTPRNRRADSEHAFSGRSLADNVVTPFLRDRAIPISASPYLSALRGGAKFKKGGAPRIQRDKEGFDALVAVVDYLRALGVDEAKAYLRYLL